MRAWRRGTAAGLLCPLLCLPMNPAEAQAPHTHDHRFVDAEFWAQAFDDPARDQWQKPHQVIEALALPEAALVADIGAGTGYFTVRLAHMLPAGRVYAVDVEPDMVRYVAQRAQRSQLNNVAAILAKPADPMLPEPVDLVLLVDTYHHIADRVRYLAQLARYLKTDGSVAVIDFNARSPVGPPIAERIPAEQVEREMAEGGFTLRTQHDFLPNQYFLVFKLRATH